MEMRWRDWLLLYWPILGTIAIAVVGAIYAAGFAAGSRAMLSAAELSAKEARGEA